MIYGTYRSYGARPPAPRPLTPPRPGLSFAERLARGGVSAPLVRALVFKTSGRIEEMRQWVRFPYTPASGPARYRGDSRYLAE